MIALWILVSLILLVIFGKWVLLVFLSPIISWHCNREAVKAALLQKEDEEIIKTGRLNELHEISPSNPKLSLFLHLKSTIYSYLSGFERYILIKIGYIPSHHIRDFFYRNVFKVNMAKGSVIYYGAELRGQYNLTLMKGAIVGDRCTIDARRGFIRIGRNVQLGNNVNLWTGSHDMNDPYFRSMPGKRGPIIIEDYVWIGPGATVLHSVKIGKGSVIAAGSIITKDVEPFSVMAGVPAKKIGERNHDMKYDLSKFHIPFY